MINNKRALIENISSIILAVIAIVGLIFLAVKLTTLFVDNEKANAKSFMNSLEKKIENLKDGESNNFALMGVKDWVLVGWNKSVPIAEDDDISMDKKPQKCFDKNCLCLCKDNIENCQDIGYCKMMDRDVRVEGKYFDQNVDGINQFNYVVSCIVHKNSLMNFLINKEKNLVSVNYDYGSLTEYGISKNEETEISKLKNNLNSCGYKLDVK